MPHSSTDDSMYISLLFLAMSAADRKILRDELFISEKCTIDYGIDEKEWDRILNLSFITYFNEGKEAVIDAVEHLKISLDEEKKAELVEDLLAVALIDNNYHENEKKLLEEIAAGFNVPCPDPDGI